MLIHPLLLYHIEPPKPWMATKTMLRTEKKWKKSLDLIQIYSQSLNAFHFIKER